MSQPRKRRRSLIGGLLFLDLLVDRRTRPLIVYVFIIIGVGAALYHWLEGWGWLDSFYFVVVTLTTIGYGDFSPTTSLTKLITIFYGLNGVIILLMLFDVVRRVRRWDLSARSEEGEGDTKDPA